MSNLHADASQTPVQLRALPASYRMQASEGHDLLGSELAPVRITVFGDFQCPACARADTILGSLYARHVDAVSVHYRHYPLQDLHEHAFEAAVAAECAAEQGAFRDYYKVLLNEQSVLGRVPWSDLAGLAAVSDVEQFSACLGSPAAHDRVTADTTLAYQLGVRSTPTYLINDYFLTTNPSIEQWDRLIQRFLANPSGNNAGNE